MSARMGLLLCLVMACGSDKVDPADATAADLRGRWVRPLAEDTQRVFAFGEQGSFHPALAEATDVFAVYDFTAGAQIPRMFGTYRVESGVIVQTPVWEGWSGTGMSEYRNDLLSLTSGRELIIEGGEGTPSTYAYLETCEVPVGVDGWRRHGMAAALWNSVGGIGRIAVTVAFDPTGAIVATSSNAVVRYGGDCIPEATSEETLGDSSVHRAPDGIHVITGRHMGGDAVPAAYTRLLPGPLKLDPRPLPLDGREIVDATDLGGKIGILLRPMSGGLTLVRDDGADFTSTPVVDASSQFLPAELLDAGDGRALIVGTDYPDGPLRLALLEETDAGFATSEVPIPTLATYVAAAIEDGDLWIVYAADLDPGVGRPLLLHLATRRAGTWTTTPLTIGALPQIAVQGGVAHIASGVVTPIEMTTHYTRVDGEKIDEWIVGGAVFGPYGMAGPTVAVAEDESVLVGFQGGLHLRRPDDRDERRVPITVTISGSGEVKSRDGTIDCAESCTVMAEVGRRLWVTATATSGGTPTLTCPSAIGGIDPNRPELCAVSVTSVEGQIPLTITATFP